jgi:CBS domain-containing protein
MTDERCPAEDQAEGAIGRPLRDDRLVGILTDRDVVVRVVAEGPRPG